MAFVFALSINTDKSVILAYDRAYYPKLEREGTVRRLSSAWEALLVPASPRS